MTSVNTMLRSPLANAIALHDFTYKKADVKGWFEYTVAFLEKYDITPTRIDGVGNSKANLTFSRGRKKLEALDFQVDGLWFGANPPDHYSDAFDVIASTHLILNPKKTTLAFCFNNLIIPWDATLLKRLIRDLAQFLGAQYGYAYQRSWVHGPWAYPYGTIAHGGGDRDRITREEEKRIAQWARAYNWSNKYRTGDLRDIYPINILCRTHLERKLEALSASPTLQQWIQSNKRHGTLGSLEETNPELWAWGSTDREHFLCTRGSFANWNGSMRIGALSKKLR